MKIFRKINHNPDLALALGYFDGVHLAHQKLISHVVDYAKENKKKSAVITFEINPSNYFNKEKVYNVCSNEERLERIEALGVDFVYILDFEQYMQYEALDYLENVLVKNFQPCCIATGFNHKFGRGKEGDTKLLSKYSDKFGYKYMELSPQKIQTCLISSSNIREMISNGHIRNANLLLGHSFSLKNNVVKGDAIARKLGFPTANIFWPNNIVHLPHGVYFGYAVVDKTYPALINWGVRPTFDDSEEEVVEVHILNFDSQIYGKIIRVLFLMKIRDEIKFPNKEALIKQIQEDVETARKLARLS